MSIEKACDYMKRVHPAHSTPIVLRLCMDARKGDCPYYIPISINTDFISFEQRFCGFEFKK